MTITHVPDLLSASDKAQVSERLATQGLDRRLPALDGLRGFATIAVVLSHYLGELPNGLDIFKVGWIAVDLFYVLSGFLIGKLIMEKSHHANFFSVFYLRRICRTFPIYFACLGLIFALDAIAHWNHALDDGVRFSPWAYLTFTQNFSMAASGSIGNHWLAPTWTLALEEQFYLFAPLLLVLTPKRFLLHVLLALIAAAPLLRLCVMTIWPEYHMADNVLLPFKLDVLAAGVAAAILFKNFPEWIAKNTTLVRVSPVIFAAIALGLSVSDGWVSGIGDVLRPFFVSLACAGYILILALDMPEAQRFKGPISGFYCRISYAVYLTHIMVLGILHTLILGAAPDFGTVEKVAVSVLAFAVTTALSLALTKWLEEPITAFGRSFKWK
jgi:peptidoglycan/LPS O-acetylase OafA/YrhL